MRIINGKKICALIPIKHNSTRVPGKNYREFNGRLLFQIIIETLLKSEHISHIVIDTNSPIVKDTILEKYSDQRIQIYDRPVHLWDGDIPTNKLFENVISELNLDYDLYFQTHTTNPLLSTDTIDRCIEFFIEKQKEGYDSLFSVKKHQTRLYYIEDDTVKALNHNPNELLPTQDLDPLYEENSCMYLFSKKTLFERHHRIGYKPIMYVMDDIESADIDIETDFKVAKILHKNLVVDKENKGTVLVTGANGGIGKAIVKQFKDNGWVVIGTDIHESNDCHADHYIPIDLTEKDSIKGLIDRITDLGIGLDCIVNNAARQICKPIWEMSEEEWDSVYDCNVKSVYASVKYGLDLLKYSKNPNIVNIGSVHGTNTSDEIACYGSSKAAIVGLTRNLAIELGQFNIRVNCVSPGAIDTPMLRSGLMRGHVGDGSEKDQVNNLADKHILGRIGKPDEVASAVYHVTQNKNITGSNLVIDGGATIKLSTE